MTHALAGRGRRSVRDEGDVLDIVHGNHQPALATCLLQQDDFVLEQHDILCVRMSCIRSMYSQCNFCSRGQTSLS
jgi:hypothetical protein